MSATNLSTVTTILIESYGNTAKNVISAYRVGGERMVGFLEQRWDQAFKASSAQLTKEVKQNAQAAQQAFGGYYTKGLNFTTDGATQVVNQIVKLAAHGVQQVAANASRFEEKTGVSALNQLASAAIPAAQAAGRLATQLEQKSGMLVSKIAGDNVVVAAVKRQTPFKKARVRKAA